MSLLLSCLVLLQGLYSTLIPRLSDGLRNPRTSTDEMLMLSTLSADQVDPRMINGFTPGSQASFGPQAETGMLMRMETVKEDNLYRVQLRDTSGALFMYGYYLDKAMRRPHGSIFYYYANGSIARVNNYQQGSPEGLWIRYYMNGQVLDSARFADGNKEGPYIKYYPNGAVHSQGFYEDDLAYGIWKQYYANGSISAEKYFERNQLVSVRYHTRSGQVIEEKPTGLIGKKDIVFFDHLLEIENVLKYATYFGAPEKRKQGMISFTLYTMEGDKAAMLHFTDRSYRNKSGPFLKYNATGQLVISAAFRENRLDGAFTRWYDNGVKSDSGMMRKGRSEGVWMGWYNDGQKRDSGQMVHGYREGLWTRWEKGTQVRSIGLYRQGMPSGEWKFYDANGKFLYARKYNQSYRYGVPTR